MREEAGLLAIDVNLQNSSGWLIDKIREWIANIQKE
jgi:hypothetical protein